MVNSKTIKVVLSKGFMIDRERVKGLTRNEEWVYYNLMKLVVWEPDGIVHKEYGILVPCGSLIISWKELAEFIGMKVRTLRDNIDRLEKKGLIKVEKTSPLKGRDGTKPRLMFTVIDYIQLQTISFNDESEEDMQHVFKVD